MLTDFFDTKWLVNSAADIIVLVSIAIWVTVLLLPPTIFNYGYADQRQLVLRRWMLIWAACYGIRALLVWTTRYPRTPYNQVENYVAANPLLGSLLILTGVRSTQTDFMFSGHTATWTVLTLMAHTYIGGNNVFTTLYTVLNAIGVFMLIAVREHYTADVVVAFFIAKMVFWIYHLVLTKWLHRWVVAIGQPGYVISKSGGGGGGGMFAEIHGFFKWLDGAGPRSGEWD